MLSPNPAGLHSPSCDRGGNDYIKLILACRHTKTPNLQWLEILEKSSPRALAHKDQCAARDPIPRSTKTPFHDFGTQRRRFFLGNSSSASSLQLSFLAHESPHTLLIVLMHDPIHVNMNIDILVSIKEEARTGNQQVC